MRKDARIWHALPAALFLCLVGIPVVLATIRLMMVTGEVPLLVELDSPWSGIVSDALWFSVGEATVSAILTILIGLPTAWLLARWRWPCHGVLRAIFTMPFVMPTMVAAVGFLMIFDNDGPLNWIGIDLLGGTGVVGDLSAWLGWQDAGQFLALTLAHAWFNLALMIRFVEPVISRLDPSLEENARLLPHGSTRLGRMRRLWVPVLWPNVVAAAGLAWVFSFTSFALVKHLSRGSMTLESLMAEYGGSAGIPNYNLHSSEIVLAAASMQFLIIITALILISSLQGRRQRYLPFRTEAATRLGLPSMRKDPRSIWRPTSMVLMIVLVLAPLLAVIKGSLVVKDYADGSSNWTIEPWISAFQTSWGGSTMVESLMMSIGYASITMLIALPLGWGFASSIVQAQRNASQSVDLRSRARWRLWAVFNDVLAMSPLAFSAVMVGLGLLIGVLRFSPELLHQWWLPAWGHIVIATPFVLRVMISSMRDLDPIHEEAAALLGAGPWRRWMSIRLPLLRGPAIVAASLSLAISLGEFGSSWVVMRIQSWSTLPLFIDSMVAKPHDPMARPVALVGAVVLMLLTMALFISVERFRPKGREGEF